MNKDTQSWSNSNLTEMEELLQKVQQLETENAEQCVLLGKGGERECALLGKVERLERENAALRLLADGHEETIERLERQNAALKIESNRLRVVLQDIADASGFDNIGNWARNKAKDILAK